mgnify:CR=1 FL=1
MEHNLLKNIEVLEKAGNFNVENVSALVLSSKKIIKDCLFFAMRGGKFDGHDFIDEVIEGGARVIICEKIPKNINKEALYIKVADTNIACAIISSNFYGNPSSKLKLIGITGTNGKTTVASLSAELMRKLGYKVGLISTVGDKILGEKTVEVESGRTTPTTPDSIVINDLLYKMVSQGCSHAFMEVSSHSVSLGRMNGLTFAGGVFTNLTQDHLDFHGNMENYAKAKQGFFNHLSGEAFAISNIDDEYGLMMLHDTPAFKKFYSLDDSEVEYFGTIIKNSFEGVEILIDGMEVKTNLVGTFNAYNTLAIYGTTVELGEDKTKVAKILGELTPVSGRVQYFKSTSGVVGLVDYAHTPDAMEKILKTVNEIKDDGAKVITVFGCGGDRDSTKRPIMGRIAGELSDITIITSDNPRSEDPQKITDQIIKGIENADLQTKTILAILDRREAIKKASELASSGDVIALLGKGHEDYQLVGTEKHHFSDLEELKKVI